jgi:hypothetical protein
MWYAHAYGKIFYNEIKNYSLSSVLAPINLAANSGLNFSTIKAVTTPGRTNNKNINSQKAISTTPKKKNTPKYNIF